MTALSQPCNALQTTWRVLSLDCLDRRTLTNLFGIMKTVDDKIVAGTERHRRRPAGDPLRVKALEQIRSITTNWQQCADNIPERY